jgi:ADP-heptose:LPS heptosyltransferase
MENKIGEQELMERLKGIKVVKPSDVPESKEPLVFEKSIPNIFSEEKIPLQDKVYVSPSMTIDELMGKEKPNDDEAFVIIQDGGVGDAICATPMIESAKKFFPNKKIIVGSSHHEVLINNPNIDQLYNLAFPMDLFEKWVKPLRHFGSVIKRDIYNASAHKLFPGPLSMIWCHLYGVPFEGDDIKIYLTDSEEAEAKWFLGTFPRPVIVIHPTGAKLTFNPGVQITPNKDWFKEEWTKLVSYLIKQYDVVQVGGKNEEEIPGVTTYLMGQTSLRQTAALLKQCKTYVSIDSFVGHCGPAVGKPGVVIFGRSNPYIAGHAMNKNIFVKDSCEFNDLHCGRPQGYFGDSEMFKGQMRPWVCPNRSCMKAVTAEMVLQATLEIINSSK